MVKKIRRTVLAAALLAAPIALSAGSPAHADILYPRLSTGGCITGIADTVDGRQVCRVVGASSWSGTTNYSGEFPY